jgi:hypothetical protein
MLWHSPSYVLSSEEWIIGMAFLKDYIVGFDMITNEVGLNEFPRGGEEGQISQHRRSLDIGSPCDSKVQSQAGY